MKFIYLGRCQKLAHNIWEVPDRCIYVSLRGGIVVSLLLNVTIER